MGIRLTEEVVKKMLKENEGIESKVYSYGKTFSRIMRYYIMNGKLYMLEHTKGEKPRFRKCDMEETKRFLRMHVIRY